MFLAHVAPSFPEKAHRLPDALIAALRDYAEVLHPILRHTLASALVLLRNRDQFPCIRTLPVYFKLFALQDKTLRCILFSHIVKDIVAMHKKSKNQKVISELRNFF